MKFHYLWYLVSIVFCFVWENTEKSASFFPGTAWQVASGSSQPPPHPKLNPNPILQMGSHKFLIRSCKPFPEQQAATHIGITTNAQPGIHQDPDHFPQVLCRRLAPACTRQPMTWPQAQHFAVPVVTSKKQPLLICNTNWSLNHWRFLVEPSSSVLQYPRSKIFT